MPLGASSFAQSQQQLQSSTPSGASSAEDDAQVEEEEICFICAEEIKFFSVGVCDHVRLMSSNMAWSLTSLLSLVLLALTRVANHRLERVVSLSHLALSGETLVSSLPNSEPVMSARSGFGPSTSERSARTAR